MVFCKVFCETVTWAILRYIYSTLYPLVTPFTSPALFSLIISLIHQSTNSLSAIPLIWQKSKASHLYYVCWFSQTTLLTCWEFLLQNLEMVSACHKFWWIRQNVAFCERLFCLLYFYGKIMWLTQIFRCLILWACPTVWQPLLLSEIQPTWSSHLCFISFRFIIYLIYWAPDCYPYE